MARKALIEKTKKNPKFPSRAYTRCELCGRPHTVLRKYKIFR
ncbi:30S ribosomal protein S14, partial [Mycoplasmopsis synoviae]